MTSAQRSQWKTPLVHLALVAVIVAGCWVRLAQLGVGDLSLEELNHYYVGRALVEQGQPVLPSGVWYGRGIEYSRITEWTHRFITSPELAVRLPSAVFGSLAVVALAVGTYWLAGPVAAVAATLLFAVYPEGVIQARTGRMYSLQVLAGLIALFAGWVVVYASPGAIRRETVRTWSAAACAGLGLLVAARMQVTTLPTGLAWWLVLAAVGWGHLRSLGSAAWRRSVPLQIAVGVAAVGAIVLIAVPSLVISLTLRAVSTPYWARASENSPLLYYQSLSMWFPPIAFVGAASFAYLLLRRRLLGAYLLTMFGVPAIAFTLLPFRAPRFMLLAVAPLMIAIGIAASMAAREAWERAAEVGEGGPRVGSRRLVPALIAAFLLLLPVATAGPALDIAALGYDRIETPSWTAAGQVLGARTDLAGVPLGATRSLPAEFYWGHVDFSVSVGHLEQWGTAQGGGEGASVAGAYMMSVPGTPDMYAGVPVLPTPQSVMDYFEVPSSVVIAIDDTSLANRMVDSSLLETLERDAEELCGGRCGSLRLFLWRLPAREAGRPESKETAPGA